jgi:hypothetical protein
MSFKASITIATLMSAALTTSSAAVAANPQGSHTANTPHISRSTANTPGMAIRSRPTRYVPGSKRQVPSAPGPQVVHDCVPTSNQGVDTKDCATYTRPN